MKEYHKVDSIFKRDPATNNKAIILGDYARDEFAYLANNNWAFTEKVDGTNIRVMIPPFDPTRSTKNIVSYGGKTDGAQIPATLLQRLGERFNEQASRLMEMFPDGACLYGEGYGARIQKGGGNYRADQDFVLFDVKIGDWWLRRPDIEDVSAKLSLDIVPIIDTGTLHDMVNIVRHGFKSLWGDFAAEGIVARPVVELKTRNGHRIITKIKHRDFANVVEKAAA